MLRQDDWDEWGQNQVFLYAFVTVLAPPHGSLPVSDLEAVFLYFSRLTVGDRSISYPVIDIRIREQLIVDETYSGEAETKADANFVLSTTVQDP